MARQASKRPVALPAADFARALQIADKFNIQSGARPGRKARAILSRAVDFMQSVTADLVSGSIIDVGSARSGPDLFLDLDSARAMAKQKSKTAHLEKKARLPLSQGDALKLASIRKAFNLSSTMQAASLSVRVYESLCNNLWRGNSLSIRDKDGEPAHLDTKEIESELFRSKGP